MRKQRDWFWQIKAIGQGPDYVFIATFNPSDAERLAQIVNRHLPAGFVHNKDFILSARRGDCVVYESYLDQHTYSRLVKMQETGKQENIYYNGEIEVRDHQLFIESVLSGGMYGGTDLIIAVAESPDLTLQKWEVAYSGYSWGEVDSGTTSTELLEYLHWKELPN